MSQAGRTLRASPKWPSRWLRCLFNCTRRVICSMNGIVGTHRSGRGGHQKQARSGHRDGSGIVFLNCTMHVCWGLTIQHTITNNATANTQSQTHAHKYNHKMHKMQPQSHTVTHIATPHIATQSQTHRLTTNTHTQPRNQLQGGSQLQTLATG